MVTLASGAWLPPRAPRRARGACQSKPRSRPRRASARRPGTARRAAPAAAPTAVADRGDLAHRRRRLACVRRETVGHLPGRNLPVVRGRRDLLLRGPLPVAGSAAGSRAASAEGPASACAGAQASGSAGGARERLCNGLRLRFRRFRRRRNLRFRRPGCLHRLVLARRPVACGPGNVARPGRLAARLADVRADQRRRARSARAAG